MLLLVLDPHISFEGLLADCEDDELQITELRHARQNLNDHYSAMYASRSTSAASTGTTQPTTSAPLAPGSPDRVDFTARYKKHTRATINELDEYFKLPLEHFDGCDPIDWWHARRHQFPNLSRLALDILSIPGAYSLVSHCFLRVTDQSTLGSAVAVEQIFSGGRDTVSLRCASLKPETIRVLMLVKQQLRLARSVIDNVL